MTPQELIKKQIENQNERLFSAPMVPIDRVTATTPEGQTYNLKEVNLSQSQTQLLKAVVEMIDDEEKRYKMMHISDTQSVASNEFYRQKVNAVNRKINDILSDIKQNILSIMKEDI